MAVLSQPKLSKDVVVPPRGSKALRTVVSMNNEELERIKDLIAELRRMRDGTSGELYRHYSGAISSLRHILRMHGKDSEPW